MKYFGLSKTNSIDNKSIQFHKRCCMSSAKLVINFLLYSLKVSARQLYSEYYSGPMCLINSHISPVKEIIGSIRLVKLILLKISCEVNIPKVCAGL